MDNPAFLVKSLFDKNNNTACGAMKTLAELSEQSDEVYAYDVTTIIVTSISVYALGLIFGWVFRQKRSIWTGAILHSAWDLITWVL